jgi:hypothetical protein
MAVIVAMIVSVMAVTVMMYSGAMGVAVLRIRFASGFRADTAYLHGTGAPMLRCERQLSCSVATLLIRGWPLYYQLLERRATLEKIAGRGLDLDPE